MERSRKYSYNHYMDKPVTAAAANREFSRILQQVKKGSSFVVTSHGTPVARIAPLQHDDRLAQRAWKLLLTRVESQPARNIGRWTRDELYER